MSIEDVYFLKENSFKQNYVFMVDSQDRDMISFPDPNNYIVEFSQPFKNVIGLEVVDASVPKTMYSIDKYNNKLYLVVTNDEIDWNSNIIFHEITADLGDYDINLLLQNLNEKLAQYNIEIKTVSNPPELTNKIFFESSKPFILDMNNSTLNGTLGFNLTQNKDTGDYRVVDKIKNNSKQYRYFHSFLHDTGNHRIYAPGIVDLIGEKYIVLECPEIDDYSSSSMSYSKHNLGLAKFRLGITGYNDQETYINKTSWREFHPIGKLAHITLRFRTASGNLYDFKGLNHTIIFNIHYLQPMNILEKEFKSVINPAYNPNIIEYMQTLDEQDHDPEDDDEELSTDNINIYRTNEERFLRMFKENEDYKNST